MTDRQTDGRTVTLRQYIVGLRALKIRHRRWNFHYPREQLISNRVTESGLENIMIFSKISKYHNIFDIFDIFGIFQKMKISDKLYNNGCNTLMQYLMTISYQLFVTYVKFGLGELYYVTFALWHEPSVSVCRL